MVKIGITGAAGFIGSKLCSELQKDYEIVPVDNFYRSQINEIHGMEIIRADIRDRKVISELLDVDVVVHLAAVSRVGECEKNKDVSFDINVAGTQNIAFICYQKKIPLIFASSMAVFGNITCTPVDEGFPRDPVTFYGLTKVLGEKSIAALSRGNFPSYIIIKSNVYGDHEIHGTVIKKETVVNTFLDKAVKNEDLPVHEPGTQSKNFIHVKDAVQAYKCAVKKIITEPKKDATFFCLGGRESPTILELATLIQNITRKRGYTPSVVLVENPRKNEYVSRFTVDTSRIESKLGFNLCYTLERGIKEMVGRYHE